MAAFDFFNLFSVMFFFRVSDRNAVRASDFCRDVHSVACLKSNACESHHGFREGQPHLIKLDDLRVLC